MNVAKAKRLGRVALIGLPNAGKSTLMNKLAGRPFSAVTHKAQTTRMPVRVWVKENNNAMLLVDTAGLGRGVKLSRAVSRAAWAEATSADMTLCLIDAAAKGNVRQASALVRDAAQRVENLAVVLNKIDLVEKENLLALAQTIQPLAPEAELFFIAAKQGKGLKTLTRHCLASLPSVEDDEDNADNADMAGEASADDFLAAEITRGKVLERIHEEIPYKVAVLPQSWKQTPSGREVHQTLLVEREQHKIILIGQGGQTLRAIGMAARRDMNQLFGGKTALYLSVKRRKRQKA